MLRTIDKYEILEEIGHGGMATVYRARDTRLDRLVALKVLHPHLRGSAEARARFRREAQGVARLRHPRILEIYDYSGEDSEESYIATELLTGPTLKKLADEQPSMPAEIAACVAIEICRALAAAHEKGIVHRDVKPENILVHVDSDGRRCVKLTDFGIADMVDSQTMTATGQVLGSPGHMSPEQIEGKECDARSDIFSLGTVLYFLACGKLPFTGRNPHQVLKRIVDGDYVDPLRVRPAIGGTLRAIIVRALARDPAARHPTATDLEKELRAFVAEIGITDVESILADYLAEPARVSADLTARAIAACTALGKKACEAGDLPRAMDHFARVLALDEGNAEVLALVESVGRARRRRARAAVVGLALLAVGAAGAGAAIALPEFVARSTPPSEPRAAPRPAGGRAGSVARAVVDASLAGRASDAGAPLVPLAAPSPIDAGALQVATRIRRPELAVAPRGTGAPRRVVFAFNPVNARISVDGAVPRPYGPNFSGITLLPGRHTFDVTADECCEPLHLEVDIPPGEGEYRVEGRLHSLPALLLVRSDVPADVVVGDGLARGRTNDSIRVQIDSHERRGVFAVTVTAPGHSAITRSVNLVAGSVTELDVTLQQAAETPPG